VISNAYIDQMKHINHLETKLDDLTSMHRKSLEYLQASDRSSLLDELKLVKEEVNKLLVEAGNYQENERQFKRECKR
jgi:hypothetical protein